MKTIQTFLLCLLAALLSGCLEGIENAPRGASNDVRAAPGTFAPERPPTRSAVPEPIRNAPLADDRLTLVGSGDFGPENTRSASGGLLFVRIPLDTSLPPNTPVVSMVFVRDEHGVGRWEIDRLVRSEGGRQDATPLVGYVEPNGTSSLVPVSHFSPHAAAITRAETSLVVVPLDTYYGAGHVCVPQAAFGVTTGAPVFGALGQAYRRDGFRTDVFAAAAEALVLNGQGMQVQEALIDQILSDLQREVSTANSAAELSRYSPQALRFYRSAWGAWRAALQGRGALNPNFKYTTLANTERVVSRYFAALGAVEGATRFGSAVYREIIAHGVNVGVTQARLDSLAAVLTAADLMRDPAVANGWQRTRERIEARQAEAMTRNVAALLQVVARGVADEIRLADVVGAGLSAIGGVLSRSGGALTLLAADLAQGVASEHRAQSEICALTTIAYAAATYRPAQTHLELPRQELYWAATELLALGTAKFLRGEDASITVRALQTGLLWASDTLAAANAAGIRHYADLADEARARLVALAETRLGGSAGDDVTNPGQQADPCRDRSSCSDCFANASLGCGWCAGSSTCMGATDSGPRNGSCSAGWSTTGASCGAVTPQNPGGVAPTDPCLGLSTCGACMTNPACGWCSQQANCRSGSATSSNDGACRGASWVRAGLLCPSVERLPSPCGCPSGQGRYCAHWVAEWASNTRCTIPSDLLARGDDLLFCGATGWRRDAVCGRCRAEAPTVPDRCVADATPAPGEPSPSTPPASWTMIAAGSTVGGSVAPGGLVRFTFPKVSGRPYRVVLIPGGDAPGTGDLDLYTGGASTLSLTSSECRPFAGGTTPEVCSFTAAESGQHFVLLHAPAGGSYTVSIFEQGIPAPAATDFDPAVNPPSGSGWYDAQPFMTSRHLGADLNRNGGANADLGSVVFAMADGVVGYADDAGSGWNGVVILRHDAAPGASFTLPDGGTASTVWSLYGHVDRRFVSTWLRPGNVVRRGQPIGVVGPTPTGSSGPHLHLEVRTMDLGPGDGYDDAPSGRVNPITFLAQN
jgi:hypothetical protein